MLSKPNNIVYLLELWPGDERLLDEPVACCLIGAQGKQVCYEVEEEVLLALSSHGALGGLLVTQITYLFNGAFSHCNVVIMPS